MNLRGLQITVISWFEFLPSSDVIAGSKVAALPAGIHWLNGQLIGGNGHLPRSALLICFKAGVLNLRRQKVNRNNAYAMCYLAHLV